MDVVHTQRKMARSASSTGSSTSGSNHHRNSSPSSSPTTTQSVGPTKKSPGPLQRFRRRRRATSAPPRPQQQRRRRLLEDHYRVDPDRRIVLPGVPRYEEDWARDSHDFFNLVVLVPVVALNVMNWNAELVYQWIFTADSNRSIADAWTGEYFDWFFRMTVLYFLADLGWMLVLPFCVKSPATILQHHVATLLYVSIPYLYKDFQWCMGACMIVEVNTWFLIARRVFNKQGFPPWILNLSIVSIRVKLISVCFYITWIAIRCLLYPALMLPFYRAYLAHSQQVGTPYNIVAFSVPLHAAFCLLNLKWTIDLIQSKVRYWRRKGKGGASSDQSVSKGL